MAQISKIKKYNVEKEVIDEYKNGLRDLAIATKLNAKYNFQPPISRQNVLNFLRTIPPEILRTAKERHDESVYVSTIQELREHINTLQQSIFPQLLSEVEKNKTMDVNKVRVLGQLYRDIFKIVASLEGLIGPEKIMRAEYDENIKELSEVREYVTSLYSIVCPNCKTLIQKLTKEKKKKIEIKIEEVAE